MGIQYVKRFERKAKAWMEAFQSSQAVTPCASALSLPLPDEHAAPPPPCGPPPPFAAAPPRPSSVVPSERQAASALLPPSLVCRPYDVTKSEWHRQSAGSESAPLSGRLQYLRRRLLYVNRLFRAIVESSKTRQIRYLRGYTIYTIQAASVPSAFVLRSK